VQTIEWERKKIERSYVDTAAASAIDKWSSQLVIKHENQTNLTNQTNNSF
jgi:hypothetical protein